MVLDVETRRGLLCILASLGTCREEIAGDFFSRKGSCFMGSHHIPPKTLETQLRRHNLNNLNGVTLKSHNGFHFVMFTN